MSSIDTVKTVCDKFGKNFETLFRLLKGICGELSDKGYKCTSAQLIELAYDYICNNYEYSRMLINFVTYTHASWDRIDAKDIDFLEKDIGSFFGEHTPKIVKDVIHSIFACKTSEGKLAIPDKDVDLIFQLFSSFIKLGVKLVHLQRGPTGSSMVDGIKVYTYKNNKILPDVNVSQELSKRKITGVA